MQGQSNDGPFWLSLGTAGSRKGSSGDELGWFARPDLGCNHQTVGKRPPGSDRLVEDDTHSHLDPSCQDRTLHGERARWYNL